MKIKESVKLLRVRHYIKNGLIFVPLLFSGEMMDLTKLMDALVGFFAFSFVCSAVYIFNDIRDREWDRQHPEKCKRPIASGAISLKYACLLLAAVLALGGLCNYYVYSLNGSMWLLLYLVINIGYSIGLKNIPLLDVLIIAAGFLIRLLYGAAVTGIAISNWLYLTVLTFSLYLALGKRRGEKMRGGSTRVVLREYPAAFLDKAMSLCLTLTNGFYALWCVDKGHMVQSGFLQGNPYILTFPIVLIITFRYCMDLEKGTDGDPVEVVMSDKILLGLLLLFAFVMLALLYL